MNKVQPKEIQVIRDYCTDCGGEGYVSGCCDAELNGNNCSLCGKFCRKVICGDCGGEGHVEYKVGDEVEIFVCAYSPGYLMESLYRPKDVNDSKTFEGNIVKFIDNWTTEVMVKRKKIEVKLEDISSR